MATREIMVTVNGETHRVTVQDRLLLVHLLRDVLGLTGTHVGCDTSHCGACTVLIDGRSAKSCTVLAPSVDGSSITTIEGMAKDGELHPLQQAFMEKHGLQCGFCTPGMIMQAAFLLSENPAPSEAGIREGISGNFCRCTGYLNIVRAIDLAAGRMRGEAEVPETVGAAAAAAGGAAAS